MEICHKRKFIPQIYEENIDINTTLFVFIQIVSENVGQKKLRINYVTRDGEGCIFDGIQNLLKSVSIELELTPMDQSDFYDFSLMNEPPDSVYVDDLLDDPVISQAMLNTVPPSCFMISREVKKTEGRFNEQYYLPLYKIGKGKAKFELARWKVQELWRQIESRTRISVVYVKSEADLEEMYKSLKITNVYNQLITITNYPDKFGVKDKVIAHREEKKHGFAFVVLTDSEIDEKTVKARIRSSLVCSVLNNGIWGGEYYVPQP